jgi:hypothetical protein
LRRDSSILLRLFVHLGDDH